MQIVELDQEQPDEALLAGWHGVRVRAGQADTPDAPPPSAAQVRGELRDDGIGRRRTFVVVQDAVVGGLSMHLPQGQNGHVCWVEPVVHPDARRRGLGRELVECAAKVAARDGRTQMHSGTSDDGSAAFGRSLGAELALREVHNLLRVAALPDLAAECADAGRAAPDYRLHRWCEHVPPEYADRYAAAKEAMNDAPTGELDINPWQWNAERVAGLAAFQNGRDHTWYVVAAEHVPSGKIVGLTELAVPAEPSWRGDQYDTCVLPAHRGHGLGLWLKADMLRWVLPQRPYLTEIETWNAADNEHMLAVNEHLGFRVVRFDEMWQLTVSAGAQLSTSTGRFDVDNCAPGAT